MYGQKNPQCKGLLLFFVIVCAVIVLAQNASQATTNQQSAPKAEQILDRYIEVTGGQAAYKELKNAVIEKTIEIPATGMKMVGKIYRAAPDKLYQEFENPSAGKLRSGTDGAVCWQVNNLQGARILDGRNQQHILREAVFNPELNWRKLYQSAEYVGSEEVESQPCYKVDLVDKDFYHEIRFYNIDSGLLVKIMRAAPGTNDLQIVFEDYKKVGKILVAHRMRHRVTVQETIHIIQKIAFNADLPKDRFALPAEIKALISGK